ncbi:MAG: YfdX family protein [Thiogranum sp.]|nr:YfdX family protein [Thiogranum sp.]
MSKPKLKSVVVAALIASIGTALVSAPVYAATIQEKVITTPGKTITPQEEALISSSGGKVLRHIAQARADIHNKDADAAQTELDQADKLLAIIRAALPTTSVKDRIWVAKEHLEYEDTQEVLPDLIPIYSSLNEMMDIMPAKAARAQLDEAREHLKAGDKANARKALEATDAALQYTEVDLRLSTTRHLVAQARADLGKKKLDEADKALQAAEDGVVLISEGVEQPLFAAKAALYQGLVDLEAGNSDLAKADLQNAIKLLTDAKQSPDAATRDAAGELLGETQQMLTDLQNGDSSVNTHFHRLFERAQAYSDRAVEYLATGWERYRADGQPFKSDLIEARLHLANAQIDLINGHEPDKARKELDAANGFLDKAVEAAGKQADDGSYKKQISDLQKTVKTLSGDPSGSELAQYTTLQRQLDNMIDVL